MIILLNELSERGKTSSDGGIGRRRVLVAAEIGDGPSHVSYEPVGSIRVEKGEEGIEDATVDNRISQLGTIARDITQSPHSLLAHVGVF